MSDNNIPIEEYRGLERHVAVAMQKMIDDGWVTVNESIVARALPQIIINAIAGASFRDVMNFFNRP